VKNLALSIRLPADMRDWLEAHAYLTRRSLNETVKQMLSVMMEADPLDGFAIRQMGGRFIIDSLNSDARFGPYRTSEAALADAEAALAINGFDASNIDDETAKEAA